MCSLGSLADVSSGLLTNAVGGPCYLFWAKPTDLWLNPHEYIDQLTVFRLFGK